MAADYTLLTQLFTNTSILGIMPLMGLVLSFITCVLITRKTSSWLTLMFPVSIGWHIIGINVSVVQLMITGILYVINGLSLKTIGDIAETVTNRTKEFYHSTDMGIRQAAIGVARRNALRKSAVEGYRGTGNIMRDLGLEQTMPENLTKRVYSQQEDIVNKMANRQYGFNQSDRLLEQQIKQDIKEREIARRTYADNVNRILENERVPMPQVNKYRRKKDWDEFNT